MQRDGDLELRIPDLVITQVMMSRYISRFLDEDFENPQVLRYRAILRIDDGL
jgi:hypothetical protein